MTWRHYILLALLGLILATFVAAFQSAPGYMDADYYYAGGLQLAQGHGFTEPYLWNYLDDPAGLPHPSFAYWMPLASLLAATGGILFGPASWFAARIGFLLVAAAIPPLTAALAWSLTHRRNLAIVSGLLAVFSAFYLPFLPVTDTFGLYMLLGGVFFLLLSRIDSLTRPGSFFITFFFLGMVAGLMHLTRADGLLWLLIALTAVFLFRKMEQPRSSLVASLFLTLAGYFVIMVPWFVRNYMVFGSPLGPGGTRMLWLTTYDQLFAYPSSRLTFLAWWQAGIASILKSRFWALGINLERTLAEQGEIFLLPLIGIGFWHLRRDRRIQLAGLAWLLTLGMMTVVFPFAGARGGFFHSGAAVQPVWWALAPIGLDRVIEWGRRKRGWDVKQAGAIFRPALVVLAVLLSASIFWSKILGSRREVNSAASMPTGAVAISLAPIWSQENSAYGQIAAFLARMGAISSDIVMVANPPGFYLASGNPAIAVPDGDTGTLLEVAERYNAIYLILEAGSVPAGLLPVYDAPAAQTDLVYLGEIAGARVFLFHHHCTSPYSP
jgi:hypothetical protein